MSSLPNTGQSDMEDKLKMGGILMHIILDFQEIRIKQHQMGRKISSTELSINSCYHSCLFCGPRPEDGFLY